MNQRFYLKAFDHNLLENSFRVKFGFAAKEDYKEFERVFTHYSEAKNHVTGAARDWFLGVLDDYVNHKAKIIQAGNHEGQKKPLAMIQNVLLDFHQNRISLVNICQRVIKGQEFFKQILPHSNNKSYESSVENYDGIINYAHKILNTKIFTEDVSSGQGLS